MTETREIRLKRLTLRSMRRGTKEMDWVLMGYSGARREGIGEAALDQYGARLDENDQDLYEWVSGQTTPPEAYADLIADIAAVAAKAP